MNRCFHHILFSSFFFPLSSRQEYSVLKEFHNDKKIKKKRIASRQEGNHNKENNSDDKRENKESRYSFFFSCTSTHTVFTRCESCCFGHIAFLASAARWVWYASVLCVALFERARRNYCFCRIQYGRTPATYSSGRELGQAEHSFARMLSKGRVRGLGRNHAWKRHGAIQDLSRREKLNALKEATLRFNADASSLLVVTPLPYESEWQQAVLRGQAFVLRGRLKEVLAN